MDALKAGYVSFGTMFYAPDSPMDVDGIVKFGRAAQVVKNLRRARVGMIGFNVTRLRSMIGPEVESMDMLQLERRMDALEEKAVQEETVRITKNWEYPLGKPKAEVVERAIRMYMATVEICKEKNFSGISYKCVDGVDLELDVVHAVPSALVASAGFPYGD